MGEILLDIYKGEGPSALRLAPNPKAWTPRHDIAVKRLQSVLRTAVVACDRTLEQKIADAGPGPLRVDPHILTEAKIALEHQGVIQMTNRAHVPWYRLAGADEEATTRRLAQLVGLHQQTQAVSHLIGQALEIAVFRALQEQDVLRYFGLFTGLEDHDDSIVYDKQDPPTHFNGGIIPGRKKLDFMVSDTRGIYAGIEAKNIRQWLYPDREEIRDLLLKCCALDVVPVLISRRIHFSAFSVLNPCGVVIHQTFNQLYPNSKADLAAQVRHKDLLGFHDIRCNRAEDAAITQRRLNEFLHVNLPAILPDARESFDRFKDLLSAYANGLYDYKAFAARVKRRVRGEDEDFPDHQPGDFDTPDW